jgi:hypothetical protein
MRVQNRRGLLRRSRRCRIDAPSDASPDRNRSSIPKGRYRADCRCARQSSRNEHRRNKCASSYGGGLRIGSGRGWAWVLPLLLRLARVWSGGPRPRISKARADWSSARGRSRLLNNARKARNRLVVDGRRLRLSRLLPDDPREVSTGQDGQQTIIHGPDQRPALCAALSIQPPISYDHHPRCNRRRGRSAKAP